MAEHLRPTHTTLASLTPARVVTGMAVFAFGVLAGAGIAAWLMPPP
jgi:xanthine/uracil permease